MWNRQSSGRAQCGIDNPVYVICQRSIQFDGYSLVKGRYKQKKTKNRQVTLSYLLKKMQLYVMFSHHSFTKDAKSGVSAGLKMLSE